MVRKKIFSDPFSSDNIDWIVKKEIDKKREARQEAFNAFVEYLVHKRSGSPEETVRPILKESRGVFWGHQFSLPQVRKAYEEKIKAGLRDGTLVRNGDYIDEL